MTSTGYRMTHRPPALDQGAPLNNLCRGGVYPPDIYTRPELYDSGEPGYVKAITLAFTVRRQPTAVVTIYRAAPSGKFQAGDWVSVSEAYARQHAMQDEDPTHDHPVWSTQVQAREIVTDGNCLLEWGYWGEPVDGELVTEGARQPVIAAPQDSGEKQAGADHGYADAMARKAPLVDLDATGGDTYWQAYRRGYKRGTRR